MPEGVTGRQIALYVGAALVVAFLGWRYLAERDATAGRAGGSTGAPSVRVAHDRPAAATVHVAGAVREPGVYRLRPGARIDDAVRRAGGTTRRADLAAVNLAARVEDGRQVLVPERAPAGAGGVGSGATGVAPPATPAAGAPPIDLNTATLEQLDTLDGIGPGLAQRILAYRQEHGGFGRVEELAQVPGIGEKRMAAIRERVRV